jgi:hypothetical protein
MKQIIATRNTSLVLGEGDQIEPSKVRKLSDDAQRNRLAVIEGALTVENLLAKMIGHFFLGASHARKATFDDMILNSDWCSFSAKRKVLADIIDKDNLLQGREKEKVAKELRDVMSLRNAFAHGRLSSNGEAVWLSYFEGTPKKRELTDEYLAEVESKLQVARNTCMTLAGKMGAIKSVQAV